MAVTPREGLDRCDCGSKYWDGTVCHSCGQEFSLSMRGRRAAEDAEAVAYAARRRAALSPTDLAADDAERARLRHMLNGIG